MTVRNITGIVLRYGRFYGPGTGAARPSGSSCVHIDAAAQAAMLAIEHGKARPYNIAKPGGDVLCAKAINTLGWNPEFRLPSDSTAMLADV